LASKKPVDPDHVECQILNCAEESLFLAILVCCN
jgi:hypothetical protein